MRNTLIKGAVILAAAGFISKFLGLFFRIPIINMIGEEGIGLYQLTYPLYSFLLAIAAGVPIAVSKMISEKMALNRDGEAHDIFKIAFKMLFVFGLFSTTLLVVFGKNLISLFDWPDEAYYSLLGISFAPVLTCMLSAFRGYFQGLQYMKFPAVSQILEQFTRVIVGVVLCYVLLKYSVPLAAGGASFGACVGSLVALMFMMYKYSKTKKRIKNPSTTTFTKIMFDILKIAIPISMAQTIGSVMSLIDSFMVPALLNSSGYSREIATALYGQLTGKAQVLINVPLTLSIALAQSTVPAISESYAKGTYEGLHKNINLAYKMAAIFAIPCSIGLFILAKPILSMLFMGSSDGYILMQILSVACVFIIGAQVSTSILNGISRTFAPLFAIIIGCVVKVVIGMILIKNPEFNIQGAAIATLISYIVIALVDFILVIKYTRVYTKVTQCIIMPLICGLAMGITVMMIYSKFYEITLSNSISTLISIGSGGVVYLVMLLLTRTLSIKEIKAMM
ncbi:MAG: polysaccharide biosynthesis protein [Clostridium sp.]